MLGKPVANIVIIMIIDGYHDAAGCSRHFLPREEIENICEKCGQTKGKITHRFVCWPMDTHI